MNNIAKKVLKNLIVEIREARANRNVPCLISSGYTIVRSESSNCIQLVGEGVNFLGSWNRGALCFEQDRAWQVANDLTEKNSLKLEVIHLHDLRDRSEKINVELVRSMFQHRKSL